jgi:hypothetical protein
MASEGQVGRGDALQPFLDVLAGAPVPYRDLIAAGRSIADALIARGRTVSISGDDHWAGVWDLERLTDREAVGWGLWVAYRAGA